MGSAELLLLLLLAFIRQLIVSITVLLCPRPVQIQLTLFKKNNKTKLSFHVKIYLTDTFPRGFTTMFS